MVTVAHGSCKRWPEGSQPWYMWKSCDSRAIFGEKPIQHPLATLSGLSNVIVEALIVLAGLQVTTSPPKEPQKSTSNNSEISNLRKNEWFTISLQCSSRSKSTNPLYFPTSPLPLFAAATVSFNATLVFSPKEVVFWLWTLQRWSDGRCEGCEKCCEAPVWQATSCYVHVTWDFMSQTNSQWFTKLFWWVVWNATPLKKIRVRQLGWYDYSQYFWENKIHGNQLPPTSYDVTSTTLFMLRSQLLPGNSYTLLMPRSLFLCGIL